MNIHQRKSFWDEAAKRAPSANASTSQAADPAPARKPLRRDPPPGPAPLAVTDDELRLRLGEELDYARRMLDAMGEELAGDPGVVMRHTAALQSVDIVGQMIGHVATVIRCATPDEAVDRIGMAELKARLKRRKL